MEAVNNRTCQLFIVLILITLVLSRLSYGKSVPDENEFNIQSALAEQAFQCQALYKMKKIEKFGEKILTKEEEGKISKEEQKLFKIAVVNGLNSMRTLFKNMKKEEDFNKHFTELDRETGLNDDIFIGFMLGSMQADAENKMKTILGFYSKYTDSIEKKEFEINRLISEKNCSLLK